MRFNIFILPTIAAMASANPIAAPAEGDVFARDEYRWCLGKLKTTKICHLRTRD